MQIKDNKQDELYAFRKRGDWYFDHVPQAETKTITGPSDSRGFSNKRSRSTLEGTKPDSNHQTYLGHQKSVSHRFPASCLLCKRFLLVFGPATTEQIRKALMRFASCVVGRHVSDSNKPSHLKKPAGKKCRQRTVKHHQVRQQGQKKLHYKIRRFMFECLCFLGSKHGDCSTSENKQIVGIRACS
jgi:hypothetical protein